MYLIQAVSSHRTTAWSSHPNINLEDTKAPVMNAAENMHVDYGSPCYSPTLDRRVFNINTYDIPDEKLPKKEKKWSLGSFFRRKKKADSDSSSAEEDNKAQKRGGFLRRKKKPDKRKRPSKLATGFDHVVIPSPVRNSQMPVYNNILLTENGVLSDPTNYNSSLHNRLLPPGYRSAVDASHQRSNRPLDSSPSILSQGSADNLSTSRKSRRVMTKARVEARRGTTLGRDSSSDEDSQWSHSSSKLRSDDSIGKLHREGSMSRRSRAARTERYIRRLSRDDENLNRFCKSDVEGRNNSRLLLKEFKRSPSRSPVLSKCSGESNSRLSHSSFSGTSTMPPPGYGNSHNRLKVSKSCKDTGCNDYVNIKEYDRDFNNLSNGSCLVDNQRSISYDANIHNSYPSNGVTKHMMPEKQDRIYVNDLYRQPPPPPPRDPRRTVNIHQYGENGRPTSFSFERTKTANHQNSKMTSNDERNEMHCIKPIGSKAHSFNWNSNCRSTSEDHLPAQQISTNIRLPPRPSSATAEIDQQPPIKLTGDISSESYQYMTDKSPRSRKPIFFQSHDDHQKTISQKSLEFWKQRDQEEVSRQKERVVVKSGSSSPQMFTSQTKVQTKVFLPLQNANSDNSNQSVAPNAEDLSKISVNGDKHKCAPCNGPAGRESSEELCERKSKNLEDALDELEAIYNSLRLGDEDLLERAEQREMASAKQKLVESKSDAYPNWRASFADIFNNDSPGRRRRKQHANADIKNDDMAYRKLNREQRSQTINDPQAVVSRVSYLLATPAFDDCDVERQKRQRRKSKEPDITLDDVLYRSIKHANNTLKIVDPQPPFGIPLGPVTPAPNSDYLHASPEPKLDLVKRKKIPDVVNDDLAFRSLRKDENKKEPALPPLSNDDFMNNNNNTKRHDLNYFKKKRAVRSLSANISTLIQDRRKPFVDNEENCEAAASENRLSDVADAMEIARQVLKEKEERIKATKRGFLSDTDTNRPSYFARSSNYRSPNATLSNRKRHTFLNSMKFNARNDCDNTASGNLQQHRLQVCVPPTSNDCHLLDSKPPRAPTPERKPRSPTKESTPIPLSPLEERLLKNDEIKTTSFDDLLKELAREAKETSDRITSELNHLSDTEKKVNEKTERDATEPEKHESCIGKDSEVDRKCSEIDAVSERAKECHKVLENVTNVIEEIATTSDEKEKESEVPEEVNPAELIPVTVSDVVVTMTDPMEDRDKISVEKVVVSDSEHDYENTPPEKDDESRLLSPNEADDVKDRKSPFAQRKEEIVASFQELKLVEEAKRDDSEEEKETESKRGSEESEAKQQVEGAQ